MRKAFGLGCATHAVQRCNKGCADVPSSGCIVDSVKHAVQEAPILAGQRRQPHTGSEAQSLPQVQRHADPAAHSHDCTRASNCMQLAFAQESCWQTV